MKPEIAINIEDAYREACVALGEAIIAQRIMARELERLTRDRAAHDDSSVVAVVTEATLAHRTSATAGTRGAPPL